MANFKRNKPRRMVHCVLCSPRALGRDTTATKMGRIVRKETVAETGARYHGR